MPGCSNTGHRAADVRHGIRKHGEYLARPSKDIERFTERSGRNSCIHMGVLNGQAWIEQQAARVAGIADTEEIEADGRGKIRPWLKFLPRKRDREQKEQVGSEREIFHGI